MRCLAVGQKANTDSAYDINILLFIFVLIIFVVTISWRLCFQLGDKIIKTCEEAQNEEIRWWNSRKDSILGHFAVRMAKEMWTAIIAVTLPFRYRMGFFSYLPWSWQGYFC